jgi:hypothetical protein
MAVVQATAGQADADAALIRAHLEEQLEESLRLLVAGVVHGTSGDNCSMPSGCTLPS